jgi:hypothetical protein
MDLSKNSQMLPLIPLLNLIYLPNSQRCDYYGVRDFVPAFPKMSRISNENKIQIKALTDAGIKPMAIATQLLLKYETVKKYVYRKKLVAGL